MENRKEKQLEFIKELVKLLDTELDDLAFAIQFRKLVYGLPEAQEISHSVPVIQKWTLDLRNNPKFIEVDPFTTCEYTHTRKMSININKVEYFEPVLDPFLKTHTQIYFLENSERINEPYDSFKARLKAVLGG